MGTPEPMLTFRQQLQLLLDEGHPVVEGKFKTPADIARHIGVSHQTLMNLLQGKSQNPRLNTVRGLCELYGVSLNYFDCHSEEACRVHLLQEALHDDTKPLHEIATRAGTLSEQATARVLKLMDWMQLGIRAQLAQQKRKNH